MLGVTFSVGGVLMAPSMRATMQPFSNKHALLFYLSVIVICASMGLLRQLHFTREIPEVRPGCSYRLLV